MASTEAVEQLDEIIEVTSSSRQPFDGVTGEILDYTCDQCDAAFDTQQKLRCHLQQHQKKEFPCDQCDRVYRQKGRLEQHRKAHALGMESVKAPTGPKAWHCAACDKTFPTRILLKKHWECHPEFPRNELERSLKQQQSHGAIRECCCEYCGMKFPFGSMLEQHLVSHTKETKYMCEYCNRMYLHHAQLKRHLTTHTGETPYQCKHCGSAFRAKDILKRHLAKHEGVNFTCPFCEKKFALKSDMSNHIRYRHTEKRVYKCVPCDTTYTAVSSVKRHLFKFHESTETPNIQSRLTTDPNSKFTPVEVTIDLHHRYKSRFKVSKEEEIVSRKNAVVSDTKVTSADNVIHGDKNSDSQVVLVGGRLIRVVTTNVTESELASQLGTNNKKSERPDRCAILREESSVSDVTQDQVTSDQSQTMDELCGGNVEAIQIFMCEMCENVFYSQDEADAHCATHQVVEGEAYQCHVCQQGFHTHEDYYEHLVTVEKDKLFPCPHCDIYFTAEQDLTTHQATHEDGTYDESQENNIEHDDVEKTQIVTPQEQTGHMMTPREQTEHMVTPQGQTEHMMTPQEQTEHMMTPQKHTRHMVAPQEQAGHMVPPQEQAEHMVTPEEQIGHMVKHEEKEHVLKNEALEEITDGNILFCEKSEDKKEEKISEEEALDCEGTSKIPDTNSTEDFYREESTPSIKQDSDVIPEDVEFVVIGQSSTQTLTEVSGIYKCSLCKNIFSEELELLEHIQAVHIKFETSHNDRFVFENGIDIQDTARSETCIDASDANVASVGSPENAETTGLASCPEFRDTKEGIKGEFIETGSMEDSHGDLLEGKRESRKSRSEPRYKVSEVEPIMTRKKSRVIASRSSQIKNSSTSGDADNGAMTSRNDRRTENTHKTYSLKCNVNNRNEASTQGINSDFGDRPNYLNSDRLRSPQSEINEYKSPRIDISKLSSDIVHQISDVTTISDNHVFEDEEQMDTSSESVTHEESAFDWSDIHEKPSQTEHEDTARVLYCDVCHLLFKSAATLQKHMMKHNRKAGRLDSEGVFQCKYCSAAFKIRRHLYRHTDKCRLVTGNKKPEVPRKTLAHFKAQERKRLAGLADKQRREAMARTGRFSCDQCDRVCTSWVGLRGHMNTKHKQSEHVCTKCDRVFSSQIGLVSHTLRKHEGRVSQSICEICGKVVRGFPIKIHMMKCHSNKPKVKHECTECNVTFQRRGLLKQHMEKVHLGIQPEKKTYEIKYYCQKCGKGYPFESQLKQHEEVHLDVKTKRFFCRFCQKGFARRGDCTIHERFHTGELPYECAHCGDRFPQRDMLKRHEVKHTGRTHDCPHCGKAFPLRNELRQHIKNVHEVHGEGELRHACRVCGKRFWYKHSCHRHERNIHGLDEVAVPQTPTVNGVELMMI